MNTLTKNEIVRIYNDARGVVCNTTLFSKLCSLEQIHDADAAPDWYEYDATIRGIFNDARAGAFELIATRRDPFGFTAIHKPTRRAVAFSVKHANKYDLIFNFSIIE